MFYNDFDNPENNSIIDLEKYKEICKVCDEILLFGKIRSILKQNSNSILKNKENFLVKPLDSEIFIDCSEKKKKSCF